VRCVTTGLYCDRVPHPQTNTVLLLFLLFCSLLLLLLLILSILLFESAVDFELLTLVVFNFFSLCCFVDVLVLVVVGGVVDRIDDVMSLCLVTLVALLLIS